MKNFTYFDIAAMLGITALLTFLVSLFTPLTSSFAETSAVLVVAMLVLGLFDRRHVKAKS